MIKLGVNTVLFKAFPFREAAKAIKLAGYDGLEISAIQGMCEHLNLDDWKAQKAELLEVMAEEGLAFLSTEVASLDRERLKKAFEACAEIGIPVVNVGPGGKSGDEETLRTSVETLADLAAMAESYGVTLCVKAHVGAAIGIKEEIEKNHPPRHGRHRQSGVWNRYGSQPYLPCGRAP